jgi:hypothetical protein
MSTSSLNQEVWRNVLSLAETAAEKRAYRIIKKKSKCTKNLFDVCYSKKISKNEYIELYLQGWLFSEGLVLTRCRVYLYNKNIEKKARSNNVILKNYPFLDFNLTGLDSVLKASAYKEVEFFLSENDHILKIFFIECLDRIDAVEKEFETIETSWIKKLINYLLLSQNENIGLNISKEILKSIQDHYA